MKCNSDMTRAVCISTVAFCITVCAACGPKRVELPADSGSPFPDFAKVHEQVSTSCRGVRTLTAELSLRGRVGTERLSGRVIAGFERPASMRLEGVAPIGQPVFILAAQSGNGVLLLPRDSRVLRGQPAEAILEALIGVNLAPGDLLAILTGCVVPNPMPTAGRTHANGWASIDLQDGATVYLRRTSRWEVRAARRNGWQIEYTTGQSLFPASVRLVADSAKVPVDLAAGISQLEANVDLDAAAFRVDVSADAKPLTLDELREAGPLRAQ
jgi:outer membrane biogenesis lipoprotein LolB